jgi:hypothetical protein
MRSIWAAISISPDPETGRFILWGGAAVTKVIEEETFVVEFGRKRPLARLVKRNRVKVDRVTITLLFFTALASSLRVIS